MKPGGQQDVVGPVLKEFLIAFEKDPLRARRSIRQLSVEQPVAFYQAAVALLRDGESSSAGHRFLSSMLMANDLVVAPLCDPTACSLEEAIRIASNIASSEPLLDVKLMRRVWTVQGSVDLEVGRRVLEIVTAISDGTRVLPLLMQLMRFPDERIRSKATLLIGRARKDPRWLEQWTKDADPRIRANAIEALWGARSEAAITLFRKGTQDGHHRVVANALVGLHMAGDDNAADELEQIATFPSPEFRAAAAWAMGKIGSDRFVPTLKEMARAPEGPVRRSALRALVQMRRH